MILEFLKKELKKKNQVIHENIKIYSQVSNDQGFAVCGSRGGRVMLPINQLLMESHNLLMIKQWLNNCFVVSLSRLRTEHNGD